MHYDFKNMLTNGQMAKKIGVDPKTLRKWAKDKLIPSYVNPANGYRYYDKNFVMKALELQNLVFDKSLDAN